MSSEPPVSPDLIQRALRGELSGEQLDRVIVHWRDHPEDIPPDGSVADSLLAAVRDTHTVRDELTSVESEVESLVDRLVQPEFALALTDPSSNGATAAEPASPDATFIGPADAGTIDASTAESGVGDGRSKSPASPSLEATKDSVDSSIALVPASESDPTGGSHQTQRDTGLATPVESELVPGLVLGAYKIIRKLGQGGMGMVFLAEHQRMKRLVALKVLPPQLTRQPAAIQRFQREVHALARLSHPNIVTAFDADEARGLHLLVMEYVDGTDLSVLVKKQGPLPVDRAIDFIIQAARGLEYAHKRGMVHRDIKPSNILVDTEGHVKILDLGLARFGDTADVEGQELTGSGMLLGTADYMAPEQAENTKGADARADIYSLGCTLYFLLTGRTLYTGDTVLSRLLAHTKQPIPSLRATVPTVSPELDAVYQRAVAKTPDERYQSVTEFLAAISRVPGDSAGLTISSVAAESQPSPDSPTRAGDSLAGQPAASRAGRGSRPSVKTIAFAAGGAALLLFAVWIIFKDRNNNEVGRVKVEPGQQVPVQTAPGGTAVVENRPDGNTPTTQPDQTGWPAGAPQPAIAPFDAAQAAKHQEEWAAYLKVPVEYTNSIGMKFRLIPPGEFLMGSTPEEVEAALKEADPNDKNWLGFIQSEAPRHKVILTRPVYLGTNEVTQTEYEKVMGVNPSHFAPNGVGKAEVAGLKTTRHPVEMVSWYDAAEFCIRLSRLETLTPFYVGAGDAITPQVGNGYRLPSEAEWEFACRAGTTTKRWIGDSDDLLAKAGWSSANSGGRTHAVGELNANPYGLFDIQGNVWEWVEDIWDANRYGPFENTPAVNPATPLTGGYPRVFRGGSFIDRAPHLRSSLRFTNAPVDRGKNFGFRVSLSVDAVKAGVRSNGQDIGTPVASPGRTGSVPGHSDPQTQAVRSAQWIDWLSPKVQRGDFDNNPDGWLREGNAVTTNLVIQGIEVLPDTTRNAALRLTYLLRDSEGITINARDHKTGELRDLYTAADDGRVLRIRRFRTGSDPILLGEQAVSAGVSRDAPRTLEFRVFRNVLTATLNGSTTVRVVDDSLREGNFALVALKGVLVQRVEYQEFDDVPALAIENRSKSSAPRAAWHGWPADAPLPAIAPFDAAQARRHQEEWAAYLKQPVEFTNAIGIRFRLIPPGEFLMGSPDSDPLAKAAEKPQQKVTLTKPFYLAVNELTREQFAKFVAATNYTTDAERSGLGGLSVDLATGKPKRDPKVIWKSPGFPQKETHPVVNISWNDALAFCAWQGENGCRMPTEAEWEFACRAGTLTPYHMGDNAEKLVEYGNVQDSAYKDVFGPGELDVNVRDGYVFTAPVGSFRPNPFGLHDVIGNVWEWCADLGMRGYSSEAAVDPLEHQQSDTRISRGGAMECWRIHSRSAVRNYIPKDHAAANQGVRVALSIDVGRFFPRAQPATSRWRGWPADAPRPAIVPFDATLAKSHQEAWAKYLKVPAEYTNSLGMKFRLIPPGEFVMGSSQEEIDATIAVIEGDEKAWKDRVRSEGPRHPVTITRPYYLGVTEVTQGEYEKIIGKNPAHFSAKGAGRKIVKDKDTSRQPVETVNWHEVHEFCQKLAEAEGLALVSARAGEPAGRAWSGPYSLPTEAEWEFAARAGTETTHWTGPDLAQLGRTAWYLDHGDFNPYRTYPVGQLEPNPLGLCDMYGNVWEWTLDGYEQNHFQKLVGGVIDPTGPNPPGKQRVQRGGAGGLHAMHCRSSNRGAVPAEMKVNGWGCRIALSVDSVREKLRQANVTTALGFDGAGARVEIPDLKWDPSKPLTLEAWCLPSKPVSQGLVAGFSGECELRLRGRHWWFGVKEANGSWREVVATADASFKNPMHIAGVWNGSEIRLFYDGVRHGEPVTCKPPMSGSVTATIGAAPDGTVPYAGRMLQVRISTVARYQEDFDPAPALETDGDTAVLYRFDLDKGETVPDRSGKNHTGTLRGANWTSAPRIPGAPAVNPAAAK